MVEFPEIKLKQYVIVPRKPKMSPGKIASQVAHATFMALRKQDAIVYENKNRNVEGLKDLFSGNEWDNIDEWEQNGMCVIVLQCKTTEQLSNIAKYLEQWEIPHHLYIDEGLTEVDPMTPTALATGVLTEDKYWIFGQFELFGSVGDAQKLVDNVMPNTALLTNEQNNKLINNYKFVWGEKPKICKTDGLGCFKCKGTSIPVCLRCGSMSMSINV